MTDQSQLFARFCKTLLKSDNIDEQEVLITEKYLYCREHHLQAPFICDRGSRQVSDFSSKQWQVSQMAAPN